MCVNMVIIISTNLSLDLSFTNGGVIHVLSEAFIDIVTSEFIITIRLAKKFSSEKSLKDQMIKFTVEIPYLYYNI